MEDPIYLASIYRLTAVNFCMSAKDLSGFLEIDANGRPTKLTAIPFYFLISHATELYLKAALLKRGLSEADIKKIDYRHNLNALLHEVQQKGVVVTPESVNLIHGLHLQHLTHDLRYDALVDNGRKTYMPPLSEVFPMLEELLMLTRISTQGI